MWITASTEIAATGLCRDLRNPVGNDSIDHYVYEYMLPGPAVHAAPVPVVEHVAPAPAVSLVASAPDVYTATARDGVHHASASRNCGTCIRAGFNDVASHTGSLIADFAKESQEAKVEEDHSKKDYAAFVSESSQSRVEKVNKVEELQNTKASLSGSLTKVKEEPVSAVSSAAEPAKVISSLHQSCDWLLLNFDTQKKARAEEDAALNNASELVWPSATLASFRTTCS